MQKTLDDGYVQPVQVPEPVEAEEPEESETGFRKLRLESFPGMVVLYIGTSYMCQVTEKHDLDLCTCPHMTKGGTVEAFPIQPGDARACEHLISLWRLVWGRQGPTDKRTFRDILGLLQQGRGRQAMIEFTVDLARERMAAEYLINGDVYFTMDVVHDIQLAEAETQKWKGAVAVRLRNEGFWEDTGEFTPSLVPGNHRQRLTKWRLTRKTRDRLDTKPAITKRSNA